MGMSNGYACGLFGLVLLGAMIILGSKPTQVFTSSASEIVGARRPDHSSEQGKHIRLENSKHNTIRQVMLRPVPC